MRFIEFDKVYRQVHAIAWTVSLIDLFIEDLVGVPCAVMMLLLVPTGWTVEIDADSIRLSDMEGYTEQPYSYRQIVQDKVQANICE